MSEPKISHFERFILYRPKRFRGLYAVFITFLFIAIFLAVLGVVFGFMLLVTYVARYIGADGQVIFILGLFFLILYIWVYLELYRD